LQSLFSRSADQNGSVESKIERSGEPDSLQSLIKKDFWNQVGSFLKKLSAMEREVFMLRFMDHLTIREVSEVMKKNESTVKTHLYRSLQKFRREDALRHFLQESLL
jgi:RNA polymerase sigma-70 factor (ECF subfamily)